MGKLTFFSLLIILPVKRLLLPPMYLAIITIKKTQPPKRPTNQRSKRGTDGRKDGRTDGRPDGLL